MDVDHTNENLLTIGEESFPLVYTFDRFLRLLEGTLLALDRQNFSNLEDESLPSSHLIKETHSQDHQLVDFYTFRLDYWPRLPQTLTKGLSSHLVFAEMMGVIKGSVSSTKSLTPLTREIYLRRSNRLAPNFPQ